MILRYINFRYLSIYLSIYHVVTMCVLIGHCAGHSNYKPLTNELTLGSAVDRLSMCHVVSAIMHS